MDAQSKISTKYTTVGRSGTVILTVQQGDRVLANEKFDVTKLKAREAFIHDFCQKHSGFDQTDKEKLMQQLIEISVEVADSLRKQPATEKQGESPGEEIDISQVVRPERFITPEVSGITVLTMVQIEGKLIPRLVLHLQWRNGKREARPFDSKIELPGGGRLWLHPDPCAHADTVAPAWSSQGRRAWLEGVETPDPAEVFKRLCERIQ